jgi:very-short-patch-repair endonuclease/Ni/Co efflux regulator RcnB
VDSRDKNGRFVTGHNVPKEWREKYREISRSKHYSPRTEFKKGIIPWNIGKSWPENFKKRMSIIQKHNPELLNHPNIKKFQFKKDSTPWNKNRKNVYSKEVIEKIERGWFKKGQRISPETEFKKGHETWNKGIPWPEEFRRKQSIIRKEMIKNNPELLKKSLTFRRPNKTEEKLTSLFQKHFPNEFKFVGDGSFIIEGLNPDWINCNGKKLIIELFGERWHEPNEESSRKEIFSKYGFKTIVIWWKETRNEKLVIEKVRNFIISDSW